jgi:hypothetical protein
LGFLEIPALGQSTKTIEKIQPALRAVMLSTSAGGTPLSAAIFAATSAYIQRLVALAAVRHRRGKGRVGLDKHFIERVHAIESSYMSV